MNLRQLQLTGGRGVLVNMSKDSGFSLSISLGSFLGSYTPVACYKLLRKFPMIAYTVNMSKVEVGWDLHQKFLVISPLDQFKFINLCFSRFCVFIIRKQLIDNLIVSDFLRRWFSSFCRRLVWQRLVVILLNSVTHCRLKIWELKLLTSLLRNFK